MTRTHRDFILPVQSKSASVAICSPELERSNVVLRTVALFFALAIAGLLAVNASAQAVKYDVLPVPANIDAALSTYQRAASGYATARDISGLPANQVAGIQNYFQVYVPAKITQLDTAYQINEIMGHVTTTMQRAVRSQTPGAINVMRWLYGGLKPVAMGNYQPAARINAIHFIARLAKPPATRGGLPRPYGFVLTDMKKIYLEQSNSDGVRAAALQGLDRFVRYTPPNQIDAQSKQQLITEMTQLLQAEAPPGRDPLAHAFLQRYAVNILTNLSTDASLGKQLVSISTNEANPNLIALYSAAAIAKLPGKMAEGDVKTQEVLMQWAKRVLKSYESELTRLEDLDKKRIAKRQPPRPDSFVGQKNPQSTETAMPQMGMDGMMEEEGYGMEQDMDMGMEMGMEMGSMMMGGGMGMRSTGGTEKPQPVEIVASRKTLNYALQQVLLGVTGVGKVAEDVETIQPTAGLMAATPADAMEETKEWLQSINDIAGQLNDRSLITRRDYVKSLEGQIVILAALSQGKPVTEKMIEEIDPFNRTFGDDDPTAPPAAGAPPAAEAMPAADDGLDALLN